MLDKVIELTFSDVPVPDFKKVPSKAWIPFGSDDKFPEYLLTLYNKSSKHNAIINGKVNYILGNGLKAENDQDEAAKAFFEKANNYGENLNDIARKTILDIELYGGFYWQITRNLLGQIIGIYHLEFRKVRSNRDNTCFYYKEDWSDRKEKLQEYPVFCKEGKGSSIFFYSEYRPGVETYCLPNYIGALNYIESDIEVSKHTLTNAKTGFSASKFINFYSGEPPEDKKREITQRFENRNTGSAGKKIIIGFNNDPSKKPTIDDLGTSDLTKEDFQQVDNLISQNIYAGHGITVPELFGIQTPGKLGSSTELRTGYDIFKNTYVNSKQQALEKVINFFAQLKGIQSRFVFVPTDPVGYEFSESVLLKAAPKSWLLEKMGIDTSKYNDAPLEASQAPQAVQQSSDVNEHLKNLTGKQQQQLLRIIRQFSQGKLTKAQAVLLLQSSLGLNEEQVLTLLEIDNEEEKTEEKLGKQFTEEEVAEMFATCGEEKENFILVKSRKVFFQSTQECLESELALRDQFEEEEDIEDPEIKKQIRDITKVTKKMPRIFIKYSYEPLPGLDPIIPTTRPFCRKLIELNRLYTRTEIERISEKVGYSVWDRRGGFWGDKPTCRHRWVQHVVIKK